MSIEWHDVTSSYCEKIGFDPEEQEMYVEYTNGECSIYGDRMQPLDRAVFEQVLYSDSIGRSMHVYVRNFYPHRYRY